MATKQISIIDSHTGGEPTRTVISGFPDLGGGTMKERLEAFRDKQDHLRRGIIHEPRGFPAVVGALLCEPVHKGSDTGVIFFNNEGYLGMCGHGTIGVVKTLEYLGRIKSEKVRLDTVAGTVEANINKDGTVSVANVPSYRFQKEAVLQMPGHGNIIGDIAWGGNWFFLVKEHGLNISITNVEALSIYSSAVMQGLADQKITGADGARIDHIELFSESETADSINFVLCPGGEYDRSPCGTGTSAKLACLAADGLLKEGEVWRQEGVSGSLFEGSYVKTADGIVPTIAGSAYVTAKCKLIFDPDDPFQFGIS